MSKQLRRTVGALAVVPVLLVAAPAHASSSGCTGYGPVAPRQVQPGQFCGNIKGEGLNVASVGGGYTSLVGGIGRLCDTRVVWEFVDNSGRTYRTVRSPLKRGCSQANFWTSSSIRNFTARPGILRFTLLSRGASKAVVQLDIKP